MGMDMTAGSKAGGAELASGVVSLRELSARLSNRDDKRCALQSESRGPGGGPSRAPHNRHDTRARRMRARPPASCRRCEPPLRPSARRHCSRRSAGRGRRGRRRIALAASQPRRSRRILARRGTVQHDLGYGQLAFERFSARLEIDGAGEAPRSSSAVTAPHDLEPARRAVGAAGGIRFGRGPRTQSEMIMRRRRLGTRPTDTRAGGATTGNGLA